MPLPAGMLACTLGAFAPPLLVMVTDPVLPAANDSGVAGMLSGVVGARPPVTGTGGGGAAAVLPAKLTVVGPSPPGAVRGVAQPGPPGRLAAPPLGRVGMPPP